MVAPPRWGEKMITKSSITKILTTALGIAIVLVPFTAQSSQPNVKLDDLKPQVERLTVQPGFGFFLDPDAQVELQIEMPKSVKDIDFDLRSHPFAVALA